MIEIGEGKYPVNGPSRSLRLGNVADDHLLSLSWYVSRHGKSPQKKVFAYLVGSAAIRLSPRLNFPDFKYGQCGQYSAARVVQGVRWS